MTAHIVLQKKCHSCGEVKPVAEFYRNSRNKSGLKSSCKVCSLAASRAYRAKFQALGMSPPTTGRKHQPRGSATYEEHLEGTKRHQLQRRSELIVAYGGKCVRCGEADPKCLTLDERDGDGVDETSRAPRSRSFYASLRRDGYPQEGFELLCGECLRVKNFERKPAGMPDSARCNKCEQVKLVTEFHRCAQEKAGHRHTCRKCLGYKRTGFGGGKPARSESNYPAKLQRTRDRQRRYRAEMIAAYGGACACCGETTPEFLALDHIFNDGAQHRRRVGNNVAFLRWLKTEGYPRDRFQILCHNCNCAKGFYGKCPHQMEVNPPL